ncbi:hypothetical protein BO79DRAFT_236694 [Aspergillus costaricaensis CBS 115574]|uniref:Uncharacterized protein n=1 Tax=Aspergillus costaricaensis CBS 115574 TaxID=1448317 RepID=A0ACD1IIS2_9EURO|nr:hypothetical protein BO79DRAFT_236694 [Aspergillus costaricaensis CBS 115574]RAK90535.1 hypothetical protein BO79DRAFT_236694 [Aspergillus costaricaensis CBS 115574]
MTEQHISQAVKSYHLLKSNLGAGVLLYLSAACIRLLPPPDFSAFTVVAKIFCVSVSHQYCWDIVNQLTSVDEDRINKPKRPIPAGRLTVIGAKWRWFISWTISPAICYTLLGGEALVIFLLSEALIYICYVWPRLDHWASRNTFPALWTFLSFRLLNSVVCKTYPQLSAQPKVDVILSLWVLGTIHIQEFHDIDGDRKIKRRTLPVLCSSASSMKMLRGITAGLIAASGLFVVLWGWIQCLGSFDLRSFGLVITGIFHLLGALAVGVRCVFATSVGMDERTDFSWVPIYADQLGLGHICEPQKPGRPASEVPSLAYRRPRASRSRGGCTSCKAREKSSSPALASPQPSPTSSSSEIAHEPILSSVSDPVSKIGPISPSENLLSSVSDDLLSPFSPLWIDVEMILGPIQSPDGTFNPHLHNDDDRSLFNHYVHIVSRALSRSTTTDSMTNPFLATLLPMAAASETLTSVILGLSGCHWRRIYPQIWDRALARQGKALAQVSNLLRRPNQNSQSFLEACATILLLCLTELFEGTSRVWKWHLKAAGNLLSTAAAATDLHRLSSTPEGNFCLQLFHYLDAMSTISRCKPPLLRAVPLGDNSVSGIPPPLLEYLGRVNLLAAHRSRRVDDLSEIGFRTAAAHVRAQLDTWRVDYDATSTALVNSDANRATTAFEWAIRLRLHQIVDGYDPNHADVENALSHIMTAVLAIPYGSPVEGSLLFPLVIAGASCRDSMERRMVVKERLIVMENTLGFGHISHARRLLETVWADEGGDGNWARIRYSSFPGVVFV